MRTKRWRKKMKKRAIQRSRTHQERKRVKIEKIRELETRPRNIVAEAIDLLTGGRA